MNWPQLLKYVRRGVACSISCGFMVALLATGHAAAAGEWPQILGPNRNAIAADEQLADSWPGGKPRTVWQRTVGDGFAGIAVAGGRAVLFHRIEDREIAEAMDARTGKPLWKASFPTRYVSTIAPDDGPRCVPLIHNDHVYLLGAGGDLQCVSMDMGRQIWSRSLAKEFGAREGYFGSGSTPVVAEEQLLVNVGGRDGAGIVAFSLETGETLWKATDEEASYSSPTQANIGGRKRVIFVTRYNVVCIDPRNGEVAFRFPFGQRGPTVNAATPLVFDQHLFVSASYGVGAVMAKLEAKVARPLWQSDEVMSSQYTTSVYHDGYLYGIHGRQDIGIAELRCIDPFTGTVVWKEEGFGTGNLVLAGDKLLIMKTDGALLLVQPSPKEYELLAQAKVFDTTVQPLPALAGGLLYVRDTGTLKCLDVSSHSQ